jgi:flagellar biosynthesis protein FliQ
MADGNAEILISVEIDKDGTIKSFKEVEKASEETGKKVGDNIEQGIDKGFGKASKGKIAKINDAILTFEEKLQAAAAAIAVLTPLFIVLDKKFNILEKVTGKVGANFDEVSERLRETSETLKSFSKGTASLNELKFSIGKLLVSAGLLDNNLLNVLVSLENLQERTAAAAEATTKFAVAGAGVTAVIKNFESLSKLSKDIFKTLFQGKGLFGFVSTLGTIGATLAGLGELLVSTDNAFAKFAGTIVKVTGILIGGLAAGVGFAIIELSSLANVVGTKLVGFFQNATDSFNKAEQSLVVFNSTVQSFNKVTDNGIGTTESWVKEIDKLSDSLNLSQESLRKSAQEIVQVGSQLGLTEEQLKKVLKVSAEYAKVNKKDVFDTTLAVVNALNGNSQALQAYGVKLNQAAVQAFAYKQGLTESVDKLSENEKVQLRYNKLLKSYKNIAGIGAQAASTLADQQTRLKINQERLTTALGEGARIIEDNSLIAAALNVILNNLSSTAFTVAGFFGALGARILQIGGLFVGLSFKVFGVVKAIKLLNILLSSDVGIKAFQKNIPLLNNSLNGLLSELAGVKVQVNGLKSLLKTTGQIVINQGDSISKALFNVSLKALTATKALKGFFLRLLTGFNVASKALITFLAPLAPLILKIGLLVGIGFALFKAFELIEKKTGVFSSALDTLFVVFSQGQSILQPFIDLLKKLGEEILTGLVRGFGVFTFAVAKSFQFIASIIQKVPFGIIPKQVKDNLAQAEGRLSQFTDNLKGVGFDFRKLGDDAGRGIAKVNDSLAEVNLEALAALRKEFEDFGKTDLQKLQEQFDQRLELINNAYAQDLLTTEQFTELKGKILQDFTGKRFNIINKQAIEAGKQVTRTLQNGIVRGITQSVASIGESLVKGSFSFKAFVGTILNIIGDLLIQMSGAFIALGIGIESIRASIVGLSGGQALAAGLALALVGGALKAFAGTLGGEQSNIGAGPAQGSLGGGGTPADIAQPETPSAEPRTGINVVIQGDVLDSNETGSRIVSLINDAFDKEGAVVTNNARFA